METVQDFHFRTVYSRSQEGADFHVRKVSNNTSVFVRATIANNTEVRDIPERRPASGSATTPPQV